MAPVLKRNAIVLPRIHPNAGLEAAYLSRMQTLIFQMHRSIVWWITAAYRANLPEIAQDEDQKQPISVALAAAIAKEGNSAKMLELVMKILGHYWTKRYYSAAPKLAEYFAKSSNERVESALKKILKDAGFMVDWKLTPADQEVLQATIGEQVGLIKSIPEKYLSEVQGMVMRSVAAGHDLKTLTDQLGPLVDLSRIRKGRYPGEGDDSLFARTMKRAALIATDQNAKANANLTRVRQMSLGIEDGIWHHSHAGKTPRPTHVAMDGKKYKIAKGMYDSHEGRYVLPGELIHCRCIGQGIIYQ